MAGPLNSVASAIDPVQITLRPPASNISSPSAAGPFAPDDFQSALAQAQKNGATEQPGPPSSDRANDVSKSPKPTKKKSEKKSRSKKTEHKKPASTSKGKPKLAASDADESQVDPAEETDAATDADTNSATIADSKAASDEIADQQILARNLAGTSTGNPQVPSQPANTNQPSSTASNGQAGGLKPLSRASLALPKVPNTIPANASDAQPDASTSAEDDEATTANPSNVTSSTATTSQATTTDSTTGTKPAQPRIAPTATTGLKPVATDGSATLAGQDVTDQSSTLNTLAALADDDSTDAVTADAPAVASVSTIDPATIAGGLQVSGNPVSTSSSSTQSGKTSATATSSPRPTFVAANQPSIVKAVKSELLPNGGVMHMRLDPPELGVLQVSVHVKDGVVSASFQTSNDDATKLLSRSMGELKTALEAQGVSIGKMHVQQTPKDQAAGNKEFNSNSDSSKQSSEGSSSRQDEQRRETLKRMWERLANGGDPLDLVA